MASLCYRTTIRGLLCLKTVSYNASSHCAIHTTLNRPRRSRGMRMMNRIIQPYDWYEDWSWATLRRWMKKAKVQQAKDEHKYNPARFAALGPDLALAHFVVARGGAVKFAEVDDWITTYNRKDPDYIELPGSYEPNLHVEAVDWSNGPMIYESLSNFAHLEKLKYLNVSNSAGVDDWCLDLFHIFPHLVHLDISGCEKITERGLACLHKMKSLRYLAVHNMKGVKGKPLVAIMLEEMLPECEIDGLTYIGMENYEWETDTSIPVYLLEEGESSHQNTDELTQTDDIKIGTESAKVQGTVIDR